MRILLSLLCVLCATPSDSIFEGTCLRKDPAPGVLVLPPGRELVLTCSGHVMIDGVKVRHRSNTNRRDRASSATTVSITSRTENLVKTETHATNNAVTQGQLTDPTETRENRSFGHTATGYVTSPTTLMLQPTNENRLLEGEGVDGESLFNVRSRAIRGQKLRPQWKWIVRTMGGDKDVTSRRGDTLSLSSVGLPDSGTYTCYYGGRENFSIKVIVAEPPEKPSLMCYKKSPSSKIRCESMPREPLTMRPNCYLLVNKSPTEAFLPSQCSYSSRASRCWCTLEHNEEELRTIHMVYLCVTSIVGNVTSKLLDFTPLGILKPDPPSNVSVRQEEGHETKMSVTWSLPASWKSHDNFYELIYEIKYRPLMSSFNQVQRIKRQRSYQITDAMPGVEYVIQVRTKEEYDGLWSDWSTPVCASSWSAPELTTTTIPLYTDTESSGSDSNTAEVPPTFTVGPTELTTVSAHVLWIAGVLALLSVILAVQLFRHKDRVMSKLQSLNFGTQCGGPPPPPSSAPTAPEGQALMTHSPCYKEPQGGEEENEETASTGMEATHFNNTTYFFMQPKVE